MIVHLRLLLQCGWLLAPYSMGEQTGYQPVAAANRVHSLSVPSVPGPLLFISQQVPSPGIRENCHKRLLHRDSCVLFRERFSHLLSLPKRLSGLGFESFSDFRSPFRPAEIFSSGPSPARDRDRIWMWAGTNVFQLYRRMWKLDSLKASGLVNSK